MNAIASTLADTLAADYDDFSDEFGVGPCAAYATLKRAEGWGNVAVCEASSDHGKTWSPHYVIWNNGIIDLTNPFDEPLQYRNVEILRSDEFPEIIIGNDDEQVRWLKERGI